MKTIFKVGDKVFDILNGWGEVTDDDYAGNYPILVRFKDLTLSYTNDGKYNIFDNIKTLSLTEYTLEGVSQERPVTFEKDEAVAVSDNGVFWYDRYYSHDNRAFFNGGNSKTTKNTTRWKHIKKLTDFNK